MLRDIVRNAPVLHHAITASRRSALVRAARAGWDIAAWRRAGKPVPAPSAFKQRVVGDYGRRFGLRTLVETGTYQCGMIRAHLHHFDRIVSIELDDALYQDAVAQFGRYPSVELLHGDSGVLLPAVVRALRGPALFWLDAHYSGRGTARGERDTPIMKELECILGHTAEDHVVLIDDAREFVGGHDYPILEEIEREIVTRRPGWSVSVEDDIIRAHRPG
jgi:hypothetical protein